MGKKPVGARAISNFLPVNVTYGNLVGSIRNHSSLTDVELPATLLRGGGTKRVWTARKTAILLPILTCPQRAPSFQREKGLSHQLSPAASLPRKPASEFQSNQARLTCWPCCQLIAEGRKESSSHLPLHHATCSFLRSVVGKHSSVEVSTTS